MWAAGALAALMTLVCAVPAPGWAATALARAVAAQDPDPAARWLTAAVRPTPVALRAPVPPARPPRGGAVAVEIAPAQDAVLAPVPDPRPRRGARAAAAAEETPTRARPAPGQDAGGGAAAVRDAGAARPAQTAAASAARAATIRGAAPGRQTSLLGVIAGPNGRVALLRTPDGQVRRMRVGDRIEGMTVSAVGDSSVQLQGGGARTVLTVPGR
jgi:hypothetical protein